MSNWKAEEALADYLHTNEPLTDLHIDCVHAARKLRLDGRQVMRNLERANRARYIPRVGWVCNFDAPKKTICALLAMQVHHAKGWHIERTR